MTRPFGVILAGGSASRLDGLPKGTLPVGDRSMLARVEAVLAPHAGPIVLAAAARADRSVLASGSTLRAIPDAEGIDGPAAGILAGLLAAREAGATHIISAPWDCPFLPADLVPRLLVAAEGAGAVAASAGRTHPAIALWPVRVADALAARMRAGERRLQRLTEAFAQATWDDAAIDPFHNVNDAFGYAAALRIAREGGEPAAMARVLDLTGLNCPLPVLRTRKALRGLAAGRIVVTLATDPLAAIDIPHLCASEGHRLLAKAVEAGRAAFVIAARGD
jgi:molybdopterin-guanine dinucleotide biosynthesis protein A